MKPRNLPSGRASEDDVTRTPFVPKATFRKQCLTQFLVLPSSQSKVVCVTNGGKNMLMENRI